MIPRRDYLLTCVLLSLATTASLHAAEEITAFRGQTMGTTFHVRAVLPAGVSKDEVAERISERLADVNRQMSHYISDSEISRFNESDDVGEWFDVSVEFAKVVEYSLSVAQASSGAFDPTVGPLVSLWGFGPKDRESPVPSDVSIAAAREHTGYQKIEVRPSPPALKKLSRHVQLNLSAVAKGYGVDAVGEELAAMGCTAYMVEIGGEVLTRGQKPAGQHWQIGIERPDGTNGTLSRIVQLEDQALATSGDYHNYFEFGGKRYSHTLNPATGRPVEHTLAIVTVRARTCMEADALATAILVMGPTEGYDWASAQRIGALLVERNGNAYHEQSTPPWKSAATPSADSVDPFDNGNAMATYFIITVVAFGLAIAGMAIGAMLANRRIQGSCGGLSGLRGADGETACEMCSTPSPSCTKTLESKSGVE